MTPLKYFENIAAMADWWGPAIQAFGIAATTGVALFGFRRAVSPTAIRLKHDMELLKLAQELDLPRREIQARVTSGIAEVFATHSNQPNTDRSLGNTYQNALMHLFFAAAGALYCVVLLYLSYRSFLAKQIASGIVSALLAGVMGLGGSALVRTGWIIATERRAAREKSARLG